MSEEWTDRKKGFVGNLFRGVSLGCLSLYPIATYAFWRFGQNDLAAFAAMSWCILVGVGVWRIVAHLNDAP